MISILHKLHQGEKRYTDNFTAVVPGWGYYGYFWGGIFPAVLYFLILPVCSTSVSRKNKIDFSFLKLPGPSTALKQIIKGSLERVTPFALGQNKNKLPNLAYLINSLKFFQ